MSNTKKMEPQKSGSAKKLVQSRLPFSKIPENSSKTPLPPDDASEKSSSSLETRKRKISTPDDKGTPVLKISRKSSIIKIKEPTIITATEEVIILDDEILGKETVSAEEVENMKVDEKPTSEKIVIKMNFLSKKDKKKEKSGRRKSERIESTVDKESLKDNDGNSDKNPVKPSEDSLKGDKLDSIKIEGVESLENNGDAIKEMDTSQTALLEDPVKQNTKEVEVEPQDSDKLEPVEDKSQKETASMDTANDDVVIVSEVETKRPRRSVSNAKLVTPKSKNAAKDSVSSVASKVEDKKINREAVKETEKSQTIVVEDLGQKDKKEVEDKPVEGEKMEPQKEASSEEIANDDSVVLVSDVEIKRARRSVSITTPITPKSINPATSSVSSADKKLTPGQLQKKKEMEKRMAERQRMKEDRERKLNEEKELRRKEREEKELARKQEKQEKEDQKKREREEKDESRKKEKEDREKKRLEELNAKNDEKRKRDEQKEEERKKKEEEKRLKEKEKEDEENKKKRAAQMFTKFFDVKKPDRRESSDVQSTVPVEKKQNFMPFRIKENMSLAPTVRRQLSETEKHSLESILSGKVNSTADKTALYLNAIKSGNYTIGHSNRTVLPLNEAENDDLMIVDDDLGEAGSTIQESESKQIYRAKYFLFKENRRPPYYGTWRKSSKIVGPRRPLVTDKKFFDYEIDSDDEWEEDEPGESLHGSDDEEKDKESEDDYEVDNEFFVPHGYLSDEENKEEDEMEDDNKPETQKAKLKILQMEFAKEMKKKTEKIKPKLIGCIWDNLIDDTESQYPKLILNLLEARAMLFDGAILMEKIETNLTNGSTTSPNGEEAKGEDKVIKQKLEKDDIKDLIKLIHGNQHSRGFLTNEYIAYRESKSYKGEPLKKILIQGKIRELADWRKPTGEGVGNKRCWNVFPEKLKEYDMEEIQVPNTWEYVTSTKNQPPPHQAATPTTTELDQSAPRLSLSPQSNDPTTTTPKSAKQEMVVEKKSGQKSKTNLIKMFFKKSGSRRSIDNNELDSSDAVITIDE